jgi:hypothetical protein
MSTTLELDDAIAAIELDKKVTRIILQLNPIKGFVSKPISLIRTAKGKWVPEKRRNVATKRKHIPLSEIDIDSIFQVFAFCNVGGKMRLVRTVPASIDKNALTLEFMAPAEFRTAFINTGEEEWVEVEVLDKRATQIPGQPPVTRMEVKKVKHTIAEKFLTSPSRMTYDRLVFEADATKVKPTDYNCWTGFTIQPVQGDWRLMDQMIRDSLANGDREAYQYIRRWVAWCFQNPTKRSEAALVFRSEKQGTGKGTLGNAICKIFGTHAVHLHRADSLTARFNSQLAMCAFLFDDESTYSGDHAAASAMKALVTEPTLDIERKHLDVITLPNCLKIMKATNSKWAVPAEPSDRRYAVFQSSEEFANDQKYFGRIIRELDRGGLSAMLHDLMNWDLQGWHPRNDLPANQAKADQQTLSLRADEKWLLGFLLSGVLPFSHYRRPNRVISQSKLYEAGRRSSPDLKWRSDADFSKFLNDWGIPSRSSNGHYRDFGSLQELRARWMKKYPWFQDFAGLPADQEWGHEQENEFWSEEEDED